MTTQRIFRWLYLFICLIVCQAELKSDNNNCQQQIEDQLDTSKAQCENFYEYACGNWYVSHELRSLGAHDMRTQMRALNRQLIVRYFERQQLQENLEEKPDEHQQLVKFYASCLAGRQSLRVYTDALKQLPFIEWPIFFLANQSSTASPEKPFDWARANAALRGYGAQGLWRLVVQANWQASEQQILYMLAPTFDRLSDEESEFLHQRYLKYLLLEMGLKVRRAASLAEQLVNFERQLRSLALNSNAQMDADQSLVLREPQMLRQLLIHLPQLRLQEYFDALLEQQAHGEILIVADMLYLKGLQRLLHSADQFILSTWMLLQLPIHFELHSHEDATISQQRKQCLDKVNHLLPRQLARLQYTLYHQELKADGVEDAHAVMIHRVQQLFINLKLQFERLLNETTIFDRDLVTQNRARDKLRAMRLIQPWSEEPRQRVPPSSSAAAGGSHLLPLSSNYDENLLSLSKRETLLQFREVLDCVHLPCIVSGSSTSANSISSGPLDVNAYYRLSLNAIVLPMGLLRSPLIDNCAPIDAGLGYILAHEMIHAFDYDGINYDADGSLANGQWPARAIIRFGLRAGCYLGTRYSNATLTINENIADSEGLRLAFETYRHRYQQQQEQEQKNPFANTTFLDRKFFIKFAQNWCGQAAGTSSSVGTQLHASHRERVNNVLGNFPEFAEAFQCKVGSAMDPRDKCRIW
ncbi:neprilysin-1 [Drosophila tropicalis]|uniref:neprilysin-1 n=1 Tax=Drosophila tropicalis TaxID=46794 RepID=UPI0035AC1E4C